MKLSARNHLKGKITEVKNLGFGEVSAFSHACRRWTGKTPKQLQSAGVESLMDAA
jgi:AraC-like DNA-binding protein